MEEVEDELNIQKKFPFNMNICIRVSEQTKSRLKELSKEMGISQGKLVEKLIK